MLRPPCDPNDINQIAAFISEDIDLPQLIGERTSTLPDIVQDEYNGFKNRVVERARRADPPYTQEQALNAIYYAMEGEIKARRRLHSPTPSSGYGHGHWSRR